MFIAVAEYRKPIFIQPLKDTHSAKNVPLTMTAIVTADPLPSLKWLKDGKEFHGDDGAILKTKVKELDHGLKEISYSIEFPEGKYLFVKSWHNTLNIFSL